MNENVLEIRIEDNSPPPKPAAGAAPPPDPPRPPVPPPGLTRPAPPAVSPAKDLRPNADLDGLVNGAGAPAPRPAAKDLRPNDALDAAFGVPPPPAGPPQPPPGDDRSWSTRSRELRTRSDPGGKATGDEAAELDGFERRTRAGPKPPAGPGRPVPPAGPTGPPVPPDADDRTAKLMAQARERNARDRDARRLNAEAERDRKADEAAKRRDAEGEKRGVTADELRGMKGLTGPPKPPPAGAGGFDWKSLIELGRTGGKGGLAGLAGKAGGLLGGAEAAGGAAAAGGGLAAGAGGAAMAAAGPVGVAVAAALAAVAINKAVHEKAREGIEDLGAAAKGVAGNDGMGLLKKGSEATAAALARTGPAGMMMAESVRTATAAVTTFQETIDSFVARGKELQAYDARLAGANAAADVRSLQRDIREAEQTGAALARLTDAQSRLDANFSEALLPVKAALAEILANMVEPLAAASDFYVQVKPMLPSLKAVVQGLEAANVPRAALMAAAGLFFDSVQGAAAKAERVADRLLDPLGLRTTDPAAAQAAEDARLNALMRDVLDAGENLGPINGGGPGRRTSAADRVGLPLLQ